MQQRAFIQNVKPQIEGGKYFIKRGIGDGVDVSADIIADGHDVVRASLLYRPEGSEDWTESFMQQHGNDHWTGSFTPEATGFYQYKLEAWIDHLANWRSGFLKKKEAGQAMGVELAMGAAFLRKALMVHNSHIAHAALMDAALILENTEKPAEASAYVESERFAHLIHRYPLKQFETTSKPFLKVKVERRKAEFSAWYEFFPRSAADKVGAHGTFKDCEKLLPRVAEMGFDVLYFPPVHPVGEINRKGKNNAVTAQPGEPGSPWAIGSRLGGHKSVSPELGTMEDYETLVKKANELGLEVALDLALQCAPDHPYITEHPNWFTWRPDGTIAYAENPPKRYQDIVPINFETEDWKNLWLELKSIFIFWIEKGVQIFRVDNPHTKPFPFWEWCIAEVQKKYPDTIFLAEAFTRPKIMAGLAKIGFTQSYSYYTWRVTKEEIETYMGELTRTESREYYRPNFWPNTPDILPYHLHGRGSNAFALRLAMAATLSSNFGVYGPVYEMYDNESFNGREEYMDSEKYETKIHDWNKRNRLTDLMTRLNQIRKENPALQTTWNIRFTRTSSDQLMSYVKISGDNVIWCIVNLDNEREIWGGVEVPEELVGTAGWGRLKMEDLLTGETYYWGQRWNSVGLNPYKSPIHIFRVTPA